MAGLVVFSAGQWGLRSVAAGAGTVARELRALWALAEDLSWVPSAYTGPLRTTCNSSLTDLTPSVGT